MDIENIKTDFERLLSNAVKEDLERVNSIKEQAYLFGRYYDWPEMSFYESEFPSFHSNHFTGPIEYTNAFGSIGQNPLIKAESVSTFREFSDFCFRHTFILERIFSKIHFKREFQGERYNELLKFITLRLPSELIDRYIHTYNSFEFSQTNFTDICAPYSKTIFDELLSFDLCIPILMIKFSFDKIEINENISIERMNESFQLARFPLKSHGPIVHDSVLGAATHSLVLRNWTIRNSDHVELERTLTNISSYPLDQIDSFWGAFRILTGNPTGYAQVLVRPHNWAIRFKGNLPPLHGTSIRAYPIRFEEYYWNRKDLPEISENLAREIGIFFKELYSAKEKSIEIAIRRLNRCFLRDDEQDALLDTIIALEALLSDDEKQEMTHKLAMRIGCLSRFFSNFSKTPVDVFRDIKSLYSYRSAIIHGSKRIDEKREIKHKDSEPIEAIVLGIEYLRKVIKSLIEKPEYRNPKLIDESLLLG